MSVTYGKVELMSDEYDGTQPLPVPNDGPSMHDLVIQDIQERKAFGLRKYGALLQVNNGRDALQDLYDELLDAIVYVRQLMEERGEPEPQYSHGVYTAVQCPTCGHVHNGPIVLNSPTPFASGYACLVCHPPKKAAV